MGLPDIETIPETGAVFTIGRSRFADNVASHFFIRKDPVVAIECGDEHSAVICQSGRLFVFGSNDWGQLGLGHKNHISKPSCVKILKPEKVTHVACGRAHTLICTGAQKIFACGSNQEGQLGRENSAIGDSSSSPILIYDCGLAGPRIVQIAAGSHHSMILTSDGGVVAWGSNLEGQLGLPGVSGLVNKPTKVPIPEPVKEISAGYYHSAFLTESGLVYVCGESESGKLGIDVNFSTQVAPKQMQLPTPAIHVTCGGHHTLVLAENSNIYCSGSNASGQLGMGTNLNEIHMPKHLARGSLRNEKIVKIACGESHSAILTELGKLFTCGDGRHGKLGLEENENNVHEVTFAAKYQELFITNVACGGCHTILVGRRHEMDSQSQSDSTESATQNKSSLPPLKLPVNIQNDHRVDTTEKSTHEKDDSHHVDKTPKHNDTEHNTEMNSKNSPNSSKNSPKESTNIVNHEKISSSTNDEKIASPKKCSETSPLETPKEKVQTPNTKVEESQPNDEKDESKNKESTQNDEDTKDKIDDESKNVQENDESEKSNINEEITMQDAEESCTETAVSRIQEETEQETNPIPPPKPPRLKSGSVENMGNENNSSQENEEDEREKNEHKQKECEKDESEKEKDKKDESEKEKDEKEETKTNDEPKNSSLKSPEKSKSTISENITEKITEVIENSVEKIKEEIHGGELEKVETDGAQDDADVVQSPAPRTAKMAKLFKGKREEIENGTKTSSAVNPKAKSKTCIVL
ncbi:X-linked retinitis pigmentosa GTPase regulator [Camponotus floridanus]|uniref:X-linked retinitis pigmentosa GTPase regulator n=1 Tax=Camponotus floridanus TaxID=104421 RepID=UPI000DC6BE97|nr:X-linked retinitis pigmentosa GTPase regulator [Camponotus floridanus]